VSGPFRWSCAALAGALAGLAAGIATATENAVVVVEGAYDDPVAQRLVLELRSSGFIVRTEPEHGSPEKSEQSGAVLRVTPEETVEVWIVDPATRRAVKLETVRVEPRRAEHARFVAVRTVETLRARLEAVGRAEPPDAETDSTLPGAAREVAPAPQAPAPAPMPSAPSTVRSREAPTSPSPVRSAKETSAPAVRARFGVDAAPQLLFNPGEIPAALDLTVGARWMPVRALAVRALAALPLTTPDITGAAGTASCAAWMGGAAVDWRFFDTANWGASVGAGMSAAWLITRGSAIAPLVSARGEAVSALPFLTAEAARSLGTPRLRLEMAGFLGFALPEVEIRFAGREVAAWGRPLMGLSLGLGLDLF
jgi:hypothetical protein